MSSPAFRKRRARLLLQAEISRLPWRTLASLCGSDRCEDVEPYLAAWQAWIDDQGPAPAWPDWRACHDDFVRHLTASALAVGFTV